MGKIFCYLFGSAAVALGIKEGLNAAGVLTPEMFKNKTLKKYLGNSIIKGIFTSKKEEEVKVEEIKENN